MPNVDCLAKRRQANYVQYIVSQVNYVKADERRGGEETTSCSNVYTKMANSTLTLVK